MSHLLIPHGQTLSDAILTLGVTTLEEAKGLKASEVRQR